MWKPLAHRLMIRRGNVRIITTPRYLRKRGSATYKNRTRKVSSCWKRRNLGGELNPGRSTRFQSSQNSRRASIQSCPHAGGKMLERKLTFADIILIAGTRVALGAGIGLLLSTKLSREQRKAAGIALAVVGGLTTIPLALNVKRILKEGDIRAAA